MDSRSTTPPEKVEDESEDDMNFNPATVHFTEDDLKPSPIQKKARKMHVKDEDKDDRYWEKVHFQIFSMWNKSPL